mgnify:FL=1
MEHSRTVTKSVTLTLSLEINAGAGSEGRTRVEGVILAAAGVREGKKCTGFIRVCICAGRDLRCGQVTCSCFVH